MNDLDKERQTEGRKAWYAVQTFYCKEEHLGKYLEKKGVNYFIPMRYIEHETLDGKKHRKLTPAVHNLLFIEKEFTEKELLERVKDCTIPFLLVRDRSTRRCYEIPDCEMLEFRAVCDPNYKGTLYVDTVTAEARPGQAVRVIRGPFAGLEGKLTQYKKSYYVVGGSRQRHENGDGHDIQSLRQRELPVQGYAFKRLVQFQRKLCTDFL